MQSEGPGRREGGGDDVEGLLKSAGGGGGASRGEGLEGETGKGGGGVEGDSGLLPPLCGFLYTRWQAGCRLPRPPAWESGLGRAGTQLRRWQRSIQPRADPRRALPWAAFSSSFLEGFIFALSPFKFCSFDFSPFRWGFTRALLSLRGRTP